MKRILSLILALLLILPCAVFSPAAESDVLSGETLKEWLEEQRPQADGAPFNGTSAEKWYSKKDSVVEVATAEQLVSVFEDMSKNGNQFERKTIKLTADITFNEGDFNAWERTPPKYNWMDYATGGTFCGTFDGNGHTISGIYANGFYDGKDYMSYEDYKTNGQSNLHYTGLFFKLGGTVKNLRITNSYFCGPYGTAAIAGSLSLAATFENVQIDTTKVFGTYAQISDPSLPDQVDYAGPYEKHSATGAFVGLCSVTSITMKNCVFQGTLIGGGRFVGGLLGNLNRTHVEMNSCGFIGVYESFYHKYYNGVNLFKENSGGLLGRTDDTAETGTVMNDCFFIGSFKANAQSTTSGALIGRCTKFTADNCWVNDDAYDKFYDPSKTTNLKGGDAGMNWEKLSKLTGKDCVANMGLDNEAWTSVEGIGPLLSMFNLSEPSAPSTSAPADEWKISVSADGKATVISYQGTASTLTVPDTLFGYPVTAIGEEAFFGNEALRSLTLSEGIVSIGEWAFACCENLTEITLPSSLRAIESYAFRECTALQKMHLPASVESLGDHAFSCCYSLEELTLPQEIKCLSTSLFSGCESLKEVQIPEGVTSIEEYVFYECLSLTKVILPSSLLQVADNAFSYCDALAEVYYADSRAQWEKVKIGNGNTCLKNAAFTFDYFIAPPFLPGDANGDGSVNFSDIQRIYKHLSSDHKLSETSLLAADANKDGSVNFSDIQRIYQHLSSVNPL